MSGHSFGQWLACATIVLWASWFFGVVVPLTLGTLEWFLGLWSNEE